MSKSRARSTRSQTSMFRRDSFTISRLVVAGYKKSYTATGTSVVGQLDSVGSEFASIADGSFGKTFTLTTPQLEVDVRIGDRLIQGATSYEIRGKQTFTRGLPCTVLQLTEAQV